MKRTTWINVVAVLSTAALGACGNQSEAAETAARNAEAARNAQPPVNAQPAVITRTLNVGRQFTVQTRDVISSQSAKVGDSFGATVVSEVQDAAGRLAIPAGAVVYGTVTAVKGSTAPGKLGTLTLAVSSVTVRGTSYPIDASIDALTLERDGQGVTGKDALKVGVGAAAGAIVGQIIGKNPRGTVIGAAVGGAAGAGYAAATKDSDVRLPAGTEIVVTLNRRLTISGS